MQFKITSVINNECYYKEKAMPPKQEITRKDMLEAAIRGLRRNDGKLSVRNIAKECNCSTQPIYREFGSMEALQSAVLSVCAEIYQNIVKEWMQSGKYPLYKCFGMAYISFAVQEKALFRYVYMRDRRSEDVSDDRKNNAEVLQILMDSLRIDEDEAYRLHIEMWIFVHGIATLLAGNYLDVSEAQISAMLTDAYDALFAKYKR